MAIVSFFATLENQTSPPGDQTMSSLLELPQEALRLVSNSLDAPDVLNLLSAHPALNRLGLTPSFWQCLEHIQYKKISMNRNEVSTWKEAKDSYMLKAHCKHLHSAKWYQLADSNAPSAREGHLGCRIGNYVVVTGGFTEDNHIYVKDIRTGDGNWRAILPQTGENGRRLTPPWAYGATLTALDDTRAVRFGGFQAGGYSGEIAHVSVLHLTELENGDLQARWEAQPCNFPDGTAVNDRDFRWHSQASRAYHSATLLFQRYLFVVGGMKSELSVMNCMLLDTMTWTWYYDGITVNSSACSNPEDAKPTPRHGHSMVDDSEDRDRLILFGGGSGNDLLRSGHDNTEVWSLKLNGASKATDPLQTLPWEWEQIHMDQPQEYDEEDQRETMRESQNPNVLRPAEKLCLGRCHAGYVVGRDTALLLFGSGRPTTNGIICYNLQKDEFFRPKVLGPLPKARFTFASVYVKELGYLFCHGGYSVQDSGCVSNSCVLDVASGMSRPFRWWPVNLQARSYWAVTDEQATRAAGNGVEAMLEHVGILMSTPENERAGVARRILGHSRRLGGRLTMFLHLVASGQVQMTQDGAIERAGFGDDDEDDDTDDDEDDEDFVVA